MRQIRLLVIGVGCLVAGPYMIIRFYSGLPELNELEKVSGVLQIDTETTRRSRIRYPVLLVGGSSKRFKYLVWFPNSDSLETLLDVGKDVTIWTDTDRNNWVWQIEENGVIVVKYADIRAAVEKNRQLDLWLGGGAILLGAVALAMLVRQRRAVSNTK